MAVTGCRKIALHPMLEHFVPLLGSLSRPSFSAFGLLAPSSNYTPVEPAPRPCTRRTFPCPFRCCLTCLKVHLFLTYRVYSFQPDSLRIFTAAARKPHQGAGFNRNSTFSPPVTLKSCISDINSFAQHLPTAIDCPFLQNQGRKQPHSPFWLSFLQHGTLFSSLYLDC